uniref:Uncharacterized protein n=1 Tax=viral metagenome TaxID=1070528 RepID=A0A6C0JVN7_9ZZZZ
MMFIVHKYKFEKLVELLSKMLNGERFEFQLEDGDGTMFTFEPDDETLDYFCGNENGIRRMNLTQVVDILLNPTQPEPQDGYDSY